MAIRVQSAILCEFFREGPNGKVDQLGLFDRVFTSTVPVQHSNAAFVVSLVTDSEDDLGKHSFELKFVAPKGNVLIEQRGHFVLKAMGGGWMASARLAFNVQGLLLPDYGRYHWRLSVGGQERASHPMLVARVPEQGAK